MIYGAEQAQYAINRNERKGKALPHWHIVKAPVVDMTKFFECNRTVELDYDSHV
jgi:hypothetical protein